MQEIEEILLNKILYFVMDKWADLLAEIGIDISDEYKDEVVVEEHTILPTKPLYIENGIAVFSTDQIAFGDPASFGYNGPFVVVEGMPSYHTDYAYEQSMDCLKKIHRYSRKERFRFILGQICGFSGRVPSKVLSALKINNKQDHLHNAANRGILAKITYGGFKLCIKRNVFVDKLDLKNVPREQVWDMIHKKLKHLKLAKYYNRIPSILGMAEYNKGRCHFSTHSYEAVLADFDLMNDIFPKIKKQLNRKYFPSLRFTAFKLMEKHGIKTDWKITAIRTPHKVKELEKTFDMIWAFVNKDVCLP